MGMAIFRGGKLAMFFGVRLPDPSPAEEGDQLIEADSVDDALAAYDTAHATNLAARKAKSEEVETWYAAKIAAGWEVELRDDLGVLVYSPGYTLRIDNDARNEFDQLATKWTIKILGGLVPSMVTTEIYGMDEASASGNDGGHVVTVDVFLALIDAGGTYYENLLNLRESYHQAIAAGNVSFTVGDALPEPE